MPNDPKYTLPNMGEHDHTCENSSFKMKNSICYPLDFFRDTSLNHRVAYSSMCISCAYRLSTENGDICDSEGGICNFKYQ